MFHGFVRDGAPLRFLAAVAPFLAGVVLHSSLAATPGREAYYAGFGMAAVCALGSMAALLPGLATASRRAEGSTDAAAHEHGRPDLETHAFVRAFVVGAVCAAFYFHRHLFG